MAGRHVWPMNRRTSIGGGGRHVFRATDRRPRWYVKRSNCSRAAGVVRNGWRREGGVSTVGFGVSLTRGYSTAVRDNAKKPNRASRALRNGVTFNRYCNVFYVRVYDGGGVSRKTAAKEVTLARPRHRSAAAAAACFARAPTK